MSFLFDVQLLIFYSSTTTIMFAEWVLIRNNKITLFTLWFINFWIRWKGPTVSDGRNGIIKDYRYKYKLYHTCRKKLSLVKIYLFEWKLKTANKYVQCLLFMWIKDESKEIVRRFRREANQVVKKISHVIFNFVL